MANLSAPVGVATGTGTSPGASYSFVAAPIPGSYFSFDGNPFSARVYPESADPDCVRVSGSEPGVTAQGDDRDHE